MFSKSSYFQKELTAEGGRQTIELKGMSATYFKTILQYLYTDCFNHHSEESSSLSFYLNLLIYADYFAIQRLVSLCSRFISDCIRPQNVLPLMLIAQAHNASQLEQKCA